MHLVNMRYPNMKDEAYFSKFDLWWPKMSSKGVFLSSRATYNLTATTATVTYLEVCWLQGFQSLTPVTPDDLWPSPKWKVFFYLIRATYKLSNTTATVTLLDIYLLQSFLGLIPGDSAWPLTFTKINIIFPFNEDYSHAKYGTCRCYTSWDTLVTRFAFFDRL